jgi:hypothetical protein
MARIFRDEVEVYTSSAVGERVMWVKEAWEGRRTNHHLSLTEESNNSDGESN